jgi:hypothetical protein
MIKLFSKMEAAPPQTLMPFNESCNCLSSSPFVFESSELRGVRTPAVVMIMEKRKHARIVRILFILEGEPAQKP